MADDDKAARMAAVKKKAEELKKKKAKKSKKDESSSAAAAATDTTPDAPAESSEPPARDDDEPAGHAEADADTAVDDAERPSSSPLPAETPSSSAPSSRAQESKMRSASFRMGSIPAAPILSPGSNPLSPAEGGETAPDIYRKQVARIDEMDRENKRLARELADAEKRWANAEETLAELRDGDDSGHARSGEAAAGETDKLKTQIATLERQNTQLQQQLSRPSARHGSSPSTVNAHAPPAELETQLASKSATIETMELEISRLRTQVEKGTSAEKEQIAALEDKLGRAERAAGAAQRELADVKKNLDRAAEKAVRDSSERTSAETKIRTLETELAETKTRRTDAEDKVDALEKKVATLTTLHREQDGRVHALRREKEASEKEAADLKSRLDKLAHHHRRKASSEAGGGGGGGLDDDGVDELENEVKLRLERRVRELEGEIHELRRGLWRDRRREFGGGGGAGEASPGSGGGGGGGVFENVDLDASPAGLGHYSHRREPTISGGIGGFLASGLNVLTGGGGGSAGAGAGAGEGHQGGDDSVLLDDDEFDFDEEAYRKAQEEEMMRRVERVREVKRGLANWQGWRVDLVGLGGYGMGDIFEV